jgi:hypothetical protein
METDLSIMHSSIPCKSQGKESPPVGTWHSSLSGWGRIGTLPCQVGAGTSCFTYFPCHGHKYIHLCPC